MLLNQSRRVYTDCNLKYKKYITSDVRNPWAEKRLLRDGEWFKILFEFWNKESGRFRNRKGETLFIDAREIFEQISRKQVVFTDEQIQKIANTARAWRGEDGAGESASAKATADKYKDIAGYCKAVKLEEIAKNGYVLTPGRYVGVPEEEDDGVPFAEKMQKLEAELKQYFSESEKLEKEILENLRKIKIWQKREKSSLIKKIFIKKKKMNLLSSLNNEKERLEVKKPLYRSGNR